MAATRVGVIGAGAWGTALALVAARAGHDVVLWTRAPAHAAALAADRENVSRLPGVGLDPRISATADPQSFADTALWVVATPAQAMRSALARFAPLSRPGLRVVVAAKGIEQAGGRFMADVATEVLPGVEPLVLSGPGFAGDVAQGLPTAVTLAARSHDIARPVAEMLVTPTFRPYISDDLLGVQIGGAIKNVLAIAAGVVTGRGLGESARAALIARSFAELGRFGRAVGARPETMAGLSGLGDLVLTATSLQSRNYTFGVGVGRGEANVRTGATRTTEGVTTAEAAREIAAKHGVEVPIIDAVSDVLAGRSTVDEVVERLMQRPLKVES